MIVSPDRLLSSVPGESHIRFTRWPKSFRTGEAGSSPLHFPQGDRRQTFLRFTEWRDADAGKLTNAVLGAIASLTGLEGLFLSATDFDDEVADYQAIQQLPSLRRLSIGSTPTLDVDGENGNVAGTELDELIQFLEDENTTIDDTLEYLGLGSYTDAYREINADNFTRVEELLPGVEVDYD